MSGDSRQGLIPALVSYGRIPLSFEPNQGQADPQVQFLARKAGATIFLSSGGMTLALEGDSRGGMLQVEKPPLREVVKMRFMGARSNVTGEGLEPIETKGNYLIGTNPTKWHLNIPHYQRVQYRDVYKGIDVIFYGSGDNLEYDFVVRPGGHTRDIRIRWEGVHTLRLDDSGNLILQLSDGRTIRYVRPRVYQSGAEITGQYKIFGENEVRLHLGKFDSRRTLVIDPILNFSTYLGGRSSDFINGIAVDSSSNVVVVGSTGSTDFPTTPGAYNTTLKGGADVFVSKLNSTGTALLFSTIIGGSRDESGTSIAFDGNENVYITGWTTSTDFPTTPGAYKTTAYPGLLEDVFIVKLNATGSSLLYGTYLGGSDRDFGNSIALDASGNIFIAGDTQSSDFPTVNGLSGSGQAFAAKLNPSLSGSAALLYSTLLVGASFPRLTASPNGMVYLTGSAGLNFVVTPNAFQRALQGYNGDAFVIQLDPTRIGAASLLYSTYLGGTGTDFGMSIALDPSGFVYVGGNSDNSSFPTTVGAYRKVGGGQDLFIAKFDLTASGAASLVYSSFLGGGNQDTLLGLAVDSAGNAYFTGATNSFDFPITPDAIQASPPDGGAYDNVFLTKLNAAGSALIYSTYLGGTNVDDGRAIAVDSAGSAYLAGITYSGDFPVTAGALQSAPPMGLIHGFIAKIGNAPSGCFYSINPQAASYGGGTSTGSVQVSAPNGCVWNAITNVPWLGIQSGAVGTGNGTVTYQVADNQGPNSRVGTLTIAGNTFTVTQAGITCTYGVSPLSVVIPPAGGMATLTVSTQLGCPWTISSSANWITVSSAPNQVFNGSAYPFIQVPALSANQGRQGTVSVAGATVTVTQGTIMSLSRKTLNFGVSGSLSTSPQAIALSFSGQGLPWTASGSENIIVSPTSGTGNTILQVSATAGLSGLINVSAIGAGNSPQQVQVNVANVTPGNPYGSFDTPANNTIAVAGAIPVTGWALDSIQATNVGIWREPVTGETAQSNGLVFIGNAVFVAGARPDVQVTYPNAPFNYRAGWGYMLLTNFLPNASGSGASGNGTYKLHAIITNASGQTLDLGAHAITVDNVHASKPFGTIDTPGQGGTVSGNAYVNFGWALTQNPHAIPIDGSTITVILDGVPMGHPTYNQYRSDIANLFPGLANSNGAIGFFYIDTTTLANGVHTISWNVFDNAGRGDGIGSRYFTVQNTGTVAEPVAASTDDSVTARIGFRKPDALPRASDGAYVVDMEELDAVEVRVGASEGHLLVAGERRSLPIGSTVRGGVFYWQAGPGFLGEYELVFDRPGAAPVRVRVVIRPKSYAPARLQ